VNSPPPHPRGSPLLLVVFIGNWMEYRVPARLRKLQFVASTCSREPRKLQAISVCCT
jgi:hypothetical protein